MAVSIEDIKKLRKMTGAGMMDCKKALAETEGDIQAATVKEATEKYYQSILEQLFSYEDYLKFIDMYTKIQESQQEKEKEEYDERIKNGVC